MTALPIRDPTERTQQPRTPIVVWSRRPCRGRFSQYATLRGSGTRACRLTGDRLAGLTRARRDTRIHKDEARRVKDQLGLEAESR